MSLEQVENSNALPSLELPSAMNANAVKSNSRNHQIYAWDEGQNATFGNLDNLDKNFDSQPSRNGSQRSGELEKPNRSGMNKYSNKLPKVATQDNRTPNEVKR